MKHLLMAIALLAFIGCTKDDSNSVSFDQDTFEIDYNQTYKLEYTSSGDGAITFKSDDVSIATVDNEGNVTGKLVGETTITVTQGDKSDQCKIVVNPTISIYTEPYVEYSCKPSTIKAKETRTLVSETVSEIIYSGENSNVKSVTYEMDSSVGMLAAIVILKSSVSLENAKAFLAQRYQLYDETSDVAEYVNGSTVISITSSLNIGIIITYEPLAIPH